MVAICSQNTRKNHTTFPSGQNPAFGKLPFFCRASRIPVLGLPENLARKSLKDPSRDRFVLSKGHGITTLYAVLAERGFFSPELFENYAQAGSPLPEHPSPRCVPGIEAATGSLGHGLSIATGIALASKMNAIDYNVVCLLSDGECNEGSTWEAALLAPAHNLDNLIAIVDFNKWQATGRSSEVTALEPLEEKFESFGWNSIRIDGHDFRQIKSALATAKKSDKPFAIIADTVKGKGIKMMEDDNNWHYRIPSKEEVDSAFEELGIKPFRKCETPLQMKLRKLPNRTPRSFCCQGTSATGFLTNTRKATQKGSSIAAWPKQIWSPWVRAWQ